MLVVVIDESTDLTVFFVSESTINGILNVPLTNLVDGNSYTIMESITNPEYDFVNFECTVDGVTKWMGVFTIPTRAVFDAFDNQEIICTYNYTYTP